MHEHWAVGCRKFVQYIRMLYPGRFILVESVILYVPSPRSLQYFLELFSVWDIFCFWLPCATLLCCLWKGIKNAIFIVTAAATTQTQEARREGSRRSTIAKAGLSYTKRTKGASRKTAVCKKSRLATAAANHSAQNSQFKWQFGHKEPILMAVWPKRLHYVVTVFPFKNLF